jgi:DNA ligase 1
MRLFVDLYAALDATTKSTDKQAALVKYFQVADPRDAAWAIYFLRGERPRLPVPSKKLQAWGAELAGIPDWLFAESYDAVGDMAETIALLLPSPGERATHRPLYSWVEETLLPLKGADEAQQRETIISAWEELAPDERFVWNKLITGAFRVGVSEGLVARALAEVSGLTVSVITGRLMGHWSPTAEFYERLVSTTEQGIDHSRPYPFCLAHPLEEDISTLGPPTDWQAEWKWDGIRAQLVRRNGTTFLWSRGEELISDRFPEVTLAANGLSDGLVLDGEILAYRDERVLAFAQLQKRIGRKTVGKKLLADVPCRLMVFDLLEENGVDQRSEPWEVRRQKLAESLSMLPIGSSLMLAESLRGESWDEFAAHRARSAEVGVEGLMLKRRSSPYGVGRARGDWWKWKIAPMTVDAVLIYAQRGHGRRASLYTDYTFAVWDGPNLVPFAKAYSGLTDAEFKEVDRFIRNNTQEKFGPVRSVTPQLVFELAFENIQVSTRHKSGIAVRFPRMVRWRQDKTPQEADHLETIKALARQ